MAKAFAVSPYFSCLVSVLANTSLSDIVIKNWLVNPTGHANGFVPVDLLQEHMNLWIKVSIPLAMLSGILILWATDNLLSARE